MDEKLGRRPFIYKFPGIESMQKRLSVVLLFVETGYCTFQAGYRLPRAYVKDCVHKKTIVGAKEVD